MSSLVKLELISILNELKRTSKIGSMPVEVYTELNRSINNMEESIKMFEEFHPAGKALIPTVDNTAYARYDDGEFTLVFRNNILNRCKIDSGPGLMSIMLDTCALHCNSSDIEFLRIEISKGILDCQTMDMNEYLERLTAFSSTTNAIVIMPPELVVAIKISNTSTKEKPKPTVSFGEDEDAIIKAEERLKKSGSKIETKD